MSVEKGKIFYLSRKNINLVESLCNNLSDASNWGIQDLLDSKSFKELIDPDKLKESKLNLREIKNNLISIEKSLINGNLKTETHLAKSIKSTLKSMDELFKHLFSDNISQSHINNIKLETRQLMSKLKNLNIKLEETL